MAPSSKLSVVKKEETRKMRERIQLLEVRPKPEWFIKDKDEHGRTLLYLRLEITGLLPRRYGPFKNRHKALLFLDKALNEMGDSLEEVRATSEDYINKGPFRLRNFVNPIAEDHLASAYRRQRA